jgi:hypothetical protein
MSIETKPTDSKVTDETRVYNLLIELESMKKRKRIFMKSFNAEIKALQQEIDEIVDPEQRVELP